MCEHAGAPVRKKTATKVEKLKAKLKISQQETRSWKMRVDEAANVVGNLEDERDRLRGALEEIVKEIRIAVEIFYRIHDVNFSDRHEMFLVVSTIDKVARAALKGDSK